MKKFIVMVTSVLILTLCCGCTAFITDDNVKEKESTELTEEVNSSAQTENVTEEVKGKSVLTHNDLCLPVIGQPVEASDETVNSKNITIQDKVYHAVYCKSYILPYTLNEEIVDIYCIYKLNGEEKAGFMFHGDELIHFDIDYDDVLTEEYGETLENAESETEKIAIQTASEILDITGYKLKKEVHNGLIISTDRDVQIFEYIFYTDLHGYRFAGITLRITDSGRIIFLDNYEFEGNDIIIKKSLTDQKTINDSACEYMVDEYINENMNDSQGEIIEIRENVVMYDRKENALVYFCNAIIKVSKKNNPEKSYRTLTSVYTTEYLQD